MSDMATDEAPPVDERTLLHVLARLRDLRREAVHNMADPWAFRQALITVLLIDTEVAIAQGVDPEALARFDVAADEKAQEFVDSMPKEWSAHGR